MIEQDVKVVVMVTYDKWRAIKDALCELHSDDRELFAEIHKVIDMMDEDWG